MKLDRFPEIVTDGLTWIWDSRQARAARERVCLFKSQDVGIREALMSRSPELVLFEYGLTPPDGYRGRFEMRIDLRRDLALASAEVFGWPSRKMKVVGITGTNGKTTCASLMRHLLVSAGLKTAEIGTLGVSIWEPGRGDSPAESLETGFTTPEAPQLQQLLRSLADSGVQAVAMEVSSHGLELRRVDGTLFDGAIFTNLTQDHLDFHGTMAAYEAAKASFFSRPLADSVAHGKSPVAILHRTPAGDRMARQVAEGARARLVSLGAEVKVVRHGLDGLGLRGPNGLALESPMMGEHNAENIAVVTSCALDLGIPAEVVRAAVASFTGARGRLERVPDPRGERHVFVDYAHTPDAVERVLKTLESVKAPGSRLVCVLGCGGDRDRGKRPLMARASLKADTAILTSDNPRTEDPEAILKEMTTGLRDVARDRYEIVVDRRKAIEKAITSLRPGDVCLVAGKGHEEYQIIGREKRPFSDVDVCRESLSRGSPG